MRLLLGMTWVWFCCCLVAEVAGDDNTSSNQRQPKKKLELREAMAYFILVGALWGCTNPLLKRAADQEERDRHGLLRASARSLTTTKGNTWTMKTSFVRGCAELRTLLSNWQFVLPFLLNQLGSVFYLICLGEADLSLALPITQGLTFLFTALTARILGERPLTNSTILGTELILVGVGICVTST